MSRSRTPERVLSGNDEIAHTAGSTQLGNLTYSYDADGRRTALGGSLAAGNPPAVVSGDTFTADNGMTGFNGATLGGACCERSRRNAFDLRTTYRGG